MKTLCLMFLFSVAAYSQAAAEANSGYKTEEQRARMAQTLGDPHRDTTQRPDALVKAIGLKPGMLVADIGTGVGFMLPYLSAAVGDKGTVLAEDIFPDFLAKAKAHAETKQLKNVSFVLGGEKDPKIGENRFDRILILDVYHHFDYPSEMLRAVHAALKPGGQLAICDYYKRRGAMGGADSDRAISHIRLDEADMIKELAANGFDLISTSELNPKSQYVALFKKK